MSVTSLQRVIVLAALAWFAGCDGGADDGADLAIASNDLAVAGTSCAEVLTCLATTLDPDARTACIDAGSALAKTRLETLLTCGYSACIPSDAGAAPCSANIAASTPTAECRQCVFAAAQSPTCTVQFNACLAN